MNILEQLAANPEFVQILIGVLGFAWAAFKATETYASVRTSRVIADSEGWDRIIGAIEQAAAAAATETYQTYVEAIKRGKADGKLTLAEIKTARDMAFRQAVSLAEEEGIDAVEIVGPEVLRNMIELAVGRLKGRVA